MNNKLRTSEVTHNLRRLRFLRSAFTKSKAVTRRSRIRIHLIRIIKQLSGQVQLWKIKKALGTTLACSLFLVGAQLSAQNFGTPIGIESPLLAEAVTPDLADMDGDGDLDVVHSGVTGNYYDPVIGYFENTGDETELLLGEDIKIIPIDIQTTAGVFFEMADMDDDGDVDYTSITYDAGYNMTFSYSENLGNNEWGEIIETPVEEALVLEEYFDCNLVDMDGDGDLDLLTCGLDSEAYSNDIFQIAIGYAENIGTANNYEWGPLTALDSFPIISSESYPVFLEIADYDSDGDLDLLVSHYADYDNFNYEVLFIENEGTSYARPEEIRFFDNQIGLPLMTTGDLDGDGDVDILFNDFENDYLNEADLYWVENQGPLSTSELAGELNDFSLLTQVVTQELQLQYELIKRNDYELSVVNNQGMILIMENFEPSSLNGVKLIDVQNLVAGNYYLVINDGQAKHTFKFFKF